MLKNDSAGVVCNVAVGVLVVRMDGLITGIGKADGVGLGSDIKVVEYSEKL